MRQDVLHAASCGAHGVVLGMLTPGGTIDTNQLRPFVELCSALGALREVASCLAAWLPGWLAGWLAGRPAGFCFPVGWLGTVLAWQHGRFAAPPLAAQPSGCSTWQPGERARRCYGAHAPLALAASLPWPPSNVHSCRAGAHVPPRL